MNVQEATKLISDKLEQARKLYNECAALADEFEIEFRYRNADDSGGYYRPAKETLVWEASDSCTEWETSDEYEYIDGEWISSSSQC